MIGASELHPSPAGHTHVDRLGCRAWRTPSRNQPESGLLPAGSAIHRNSVPEAVQTGSSNNCSSAEAVKSSARRTVGYLLEAIKESTVYLVHEISSTLRFTHILQCVHNSSNCHADSLKDALVALAVQDRSKLASLTRCDLTSIRLISTASL